MRKAALQQYRNMKLKTNTDRKLNAMLFMIQLVPSSMRLSISYCFSHKQWRIQDSDLLSVTLQELKIHKPQLFLLCSHCIQRPVLQVLLILDLEEILISLTQHYVFKSCCSLNEIGLRTMFLDLLKQDFLKIVL